MGRRWLLSPLFPRAHKTAGDKKPLAPPVIQGEYNWCFYLRLFDVQFMENVAVLFMASREASKIPADIPRQLKQTCAALDSLFLSGDCIINRANEN